MAPATVLAAIVDRLVDRAAALELELAEALDAGRLAEARVLAGDRSITVDAVDIALGELLDAELERILAAANRAG